MLSQQQQQIIDDYIRGLERALRHLSYDEARDTVRGIEEHIREALQGLSDVTDAEVRNVLERLGGPEDIAAGARQSGSDYAAGAAAQTPLAEHKPKRRFVEVSALILLLVGGIVLPIVGWLIGLVLLWVSDAWKIREKLLGSLVVPGGLLPALLLFTLPGYTEICSTRDTLGPDGQRSEIEHCTTQGGPWPVWLSILASVILIGGPLATMIYLSYRLRRPALTGASES